MNKVFGIIGSLLFVASVVVGYFCKFESAVVHYKYGAVTFYYFLKGSNRTFCS